MKPKLSLNMIVKNESHSLRKTLESVADIVDEMIIVDTGSTDDTKKIAQSLGAKVYDFKWTDNFSDARNCAIEHTTGDWILSLDADEFIPEASKEGLLKLKNEMGKKNCAFYFTRAFLSKETINRFQPKLFIFPNLPEIRWLFRAHEQITKNFEQLSIKHKKIDLEIHNQRETQTKEISLRKSAYYYDLLHKDLAEHPNEGIILYHLGKECYFLEKYTEAAQHLNQSIDLLNPEDDLLEDLFFALVSSLYFTGRMTEGWAALKNARQVFPYNVLLISFEAALYRAQKQFDKVESLYKEIISVSNEVNVEIHKVNPQILRKICHLNLGDLYLDQKRYNEAEQMWLEVLDEFPKNNQALKGLKQLYTIQNRSEDLSTIINRLEKGSD